MLHARQILARAPLRVVRRVSELLVVFTALAVVSTWAGIVIAGLFDKTFVDNHLTEIRRLFTLLSIFCAVGFIAGVLGMYLSRGGRPVH